MKPLPGTDANPGRDGAVRFALKGLWMRLKERAAFFYTIWPWALWGGSAFLLALVLIALLHPRRPPAPPEEALIRSQLKDRPIPRRPLVIAFFEPKSETPPGTASIRSLSAHFRDIDILSPYWFRLGGSGRVAYNTAEQAVVTLAHRHQVKVWPLVGNNGASMVTAPTARAMSVRNLLALARDHHYDGVIVDYELMPASARRGLNAFVRDLARAFHRHHLGVGVAVFPKLEVTPDVQGVYDYPALGRFADAVVVMAYDRHQTSSEPGSVAPLPWVSANIRYALRSIPRAKLFMGVGAYGYDWTARQAKTVATREAAATLHRLGIRPRWAAREGESHFTYWDAWGVRHRVWFEDVRSFREKVTLAQRLKIGGIAIWRLGGETPDFWRVLRRPPARDTA